MSPMTNAEVGRLLNLDFFATTFLGEEQSVPVREDLRVAFSLTRDAERFESINWLVLGAMIGYFPRDAATALLKSRNKLLSPLTKETWLTIESFFPQCLGEARALRFEKGKGNDLIERYAPEENPLQLAVFRTSLLLGADMSRDPALRSFTTVLNFAGDPYWKDEFLGSIVDPDEVTLVLSARKVGAGSFLPEVVIAGFIRALTYMDRFQSIFGDIGEEDIRDSFIPPHLTRGTIPELRRHVSGVIGWRINAANETRKAFGSCRQAE